MEKLAGETLVANLWSFAKFTNVSPTKFSLPTVIQKILRLKRVRTASRRVEPESPVDKQGCSPLYYQGHS